MPARAVSLALVCLTFALRAWAFAPEEGLASWYGGKFQGRRTASGELFDTNQFTAAHKTLPFGTRVLVTNLDNGRSTIVRINDRGPFVAGRIIDLSRAAATAIGMTARGVAPVRLEPVSPSAAAEGGPPRTFSIQLGAFRTRSHAQRLAARLAEAGFPAGLQEAEEGIHRVLLVGIAEKDLESLRRRLREQGFVDQLVRQEPPTPGRVDTAGGG